MQITWLGHSGFRIEIEDAVLLVDPWLTGNPMFPAGREDEAVAGATHILLTHAHGDMPRMRPGWRGSSAQRCIASTRSRNG